MSETPSSTPDTGPRLKEWPSASANEIADTIEKAFEANRNSDSQTITVENEDGSQYIFRPTRDSSETTYYPDHFNKSSTIAVIHTGPQIHERFYFKVFRPNFFKYEALSPAERDRHPDLIETGAKDMTIQLYDGNQNLIGEISCKDNACTEQNGQVIQDQASELISGALQRELDKRKVIEQSKAETDKLADEVEDNSQE